MVVKFIKSHLSKIASLGLIPQKDKLLTINFKQSFSVNIPNNTVWEYPKNNFPCIACILKECSWLKTDIVDDQAKKLTNFFEELILSHLESRSPYQQQFVVCMGCSESNNSKDHHTNHCYIEFSLKYVETIAPIRKATISGLITNFIGSRKILSTHQTFDVRYDHTSDQGVRITSFDMVYDKLDREEDQLSHTNPSNLIFINSFSSRERKEP